MSSSSSSALPSVLDLWKDQWRSCESSSEVKDERKRILAELKGLPAKSQKEEFADLREKSVFLLNHSKAIDAAEHILECRTRSSAILCDAGNTNVGTEASSHNSPVVECELTPLREMVARRLTLVDRYPQSSSSKRVGTYLKFLVDGYADPDQGLEVHCPKAELGFSFASLFNDWLWLPRCWANTSLSDFRHDKRDTIDIQIPDSPEKLFYLWRSSWLESKGFIKKEVEWYCLDLFILCLRDSGDKCSCDHYGPISTDPSLYSWPCGCSSPFLKDSSLVYVVVETLPSTRFSVRKLPSISKVKRRRIGKKTRLTDKKGRRN